MIELRIEIASVQYLRGVFAFIDDSIHSGLETELHVLREVVFDIHIAVPCKVLAISQIHRTIRSTCDITHFHVVEGTMHIRIERP